MDEESTLNAFVARWDARADDWARSRPEIGETRAVAAVTVAAATGLVSDDSEKEDVPAGDALDGLTVLAGLGEWHERAELGLIEHARGRGVSWSRIAAALGLKSRQAAEQRYLTLSRAMTNRMAGVRPSGSSVTEERLMRRLRAERQQRTHGGNDTGPGEADATPTQHVNEKLTSAGEPAPSAPPSDTANIPHEEPGVNTTLTGPGDSGSARTAKQPPRPRRPRPGGAGKSTHRVRAADFDGNPYGLERGTEAGVWRVTEAGTRIGTVRRRASLTGRSATWEAWTDAPYKPVGHRTYDTRAEAAFAVVRARRA